MLEVFWLQSPPSPKVGFSFRPSHQLEIAQPHAGAASDRREMVPARGETLPTHPHRQRADQNTQGLYVGTDRHKLSLNIIDMHICSRYRACGAV